MARFPEREPVASDIDMDRIIVDADYRHRIVQRLRRNRLKSAEALSAQAAMVEPSTLDTAED